MKILIIYLYYSSKFNNLNLNYFIKKELKYRKNIDYIIISDRCFEKDENEFEGLIDFVKLEDIPKKFNQYLEMSKEQRQKIANERFELFREKFKPKNIFERAKINELII